MQTGPFVINKKLLISKLVTGDSHAAHLTVPVRFSRPRKQTRSNQFNGGLLEAISDYAIIAIGAFLLVRID